MTSTAMDRVRRAAVALTVCSASFLGGCGRSTGPMPLFAIDARAMHYPVMLSEVHARTETHSDGPIEATSSIHDAHGVTDTYIYWRHYRAQVGAFVQLLMKVEPMDMWIQFKSAVFRAKDVHEWSSGTVDEELTVEAEAYK